MGVFIGRLLFHSGKERFDKNEEFLKVKLNGKNEVGVIITPAFTYPVGMNNQTSYFG